MAYSSRIRFWGTRSGISRPSPDHFHYGGNTFCAQLESADSVVVINAGFGLARLSEELMLQNKKPSATHIILTDFAWHHLEGIGFYLPIHFKSSQVHIYAYEPPELAKKLLGEILSPRVSPFNGIESLASKPMIHQLTSTPILIDSWYCSATGPNSVYFEQNGYRLAYSQEKNLDADLRSADFFIYSISGQSGFAGPTLEDAHRVAADLCAKRFLLAGYPPNLNDHEIRTLLAKQSAELEGARENFDYALTKAKQRRAG